jgi:hypothetical protein
VPRKHCAKCGQRLSIFERLVNALMKASRCGACFRADAEQSHAERVGQDFKAAELDFASKHAGEKIREPHPGTIEGVRAAVVEAIESEWDAIRLRDELIARFGYPEKRAMLIAGTELANAFKPASRDLMASGRVESSLANAVNQRAYQLYVARPPVTTLAAKKPSKRPRKPA